MAKLHLWHTKILYTLSVRTVDYESIVKMDGNWAGLELELGEATPLESMV